MKRALTVALLLTCCLISMLTADSVLDVIQADCSTNHLTENICISSNSPEITKKRTARTDVECLTGCDVTNDCAAVFKDTNNNCYKFSNYGATQISKDVGEPSGDLFKLLHLEDTGNCGGTTCPADNVCFKGCGGEVLSDPVCLADNKGKCDLTKEFANARHYWNSVVADGRDTGIVWLVTYPKATDYSGLRVIMHTNVRGHYYAADRCHHWYLTFNGDKCTSPANIQQLDYSLGSIDYHRAADLDGICYGIKAGNVPINLVIDTCPNYVGSDGYTGWNSARSMIIMEVIPQSKVEVNTEKSCPHSAVFNHLYETWTEELDETYDLNTESRLVKAITYQKVASDTSLRIKYSGLMSVYITTRSQNYCGRWFVKINGTECDPIADAIIYHDSKSNNYDYWRHHTRVRTVEGICDNALSAGIYSIEIYTGACSVSTTQPTRIISGGFDTPSRLYIEEVRKEHSVDGIYAAGNHVYKSMTGNLQRWHYVDLNDGEDNNVVLTLTYVKQFADTGLRVTASGTHRTIHHSSYDQCSRWFFTIDNSECGIPGVIEGVSYFNYESNSHQPMQVSGMCHNIGSGTRTIRYVVGACSGRNIGDAYTGYASSLHVFAEEMRVDLYHTCSGNPVDCGGP